MDKICKKISWVNIASLVAILLGMIFGILAINSLNGADSEVKYILIGVLVIVTVISLISGIISFFGMRKGEPKTAVLGMGRNSLIQLVGPITSFILGMMGLTSQEHVNNGMITFLAITFIIAAFTTSLIIKSMKGYRKDKETYNYTMVVSFIASAALLLFMIVSLIGQTQLKGLGSSSTTGLLIVFCIMFCLSDILCYVGLGILTFYASKEAPTKTAADADARILDETLSEVKKINANKTSDSTMDNIAKLREYKKLLDEGIITEEDFEKKKQELL